MSPWQFSELLQADTSASSNLGLLVKDTTDSTHLLKSCLKRSGDPPGRKSGDDDSTAATEETPSSGRSSPEINYAALDDFEIKSNSESDDAILKKSTSLSATSRVSFNIPEKTPKTQAGTVETPGIDNVEEKGISPEQRRKSVVKQPFLRRWFKKRQQLTQANPPNQDTVIVGTVKKQTKNSKVGITFLKKEGGSICINKIIEGGLFAKTKLEEGLEVIAVNGSPISGMTTKDVADLLRNAPSGRVSVSAKPYHEANVDDFSPPDDEEVYETEEDENKIYNVDRRPHDEKTASLVPCR